MAVCCLRELLSNARIYSPSFWCRVSFFVLTGTFDYVSCLGFLVVNLQNQKIIQKLISLYLLID
jgi:hypothetical protein